jgi:cytoskeletal protein RodZ
MVERKSVAKTYFMGGELWISAGQALWVRLWGVAMMKGWWMNGPLSHKKTHQNEKNQSKSSEKKNPGKLHS